MAPKENVYLIIDSVTTALMSTSLLKDSFLSYRIILELNYDQQRPYDMLNLYLDILDIDCVDTLIFVPNFHTSSHRSKIFRLLRLLYYFIKNIRVFITLWNKKIIGNQHTFVVQVLQFLNRTSKIDFFDEGIKTIFSDIVVGEQNLTLIKSSRKKYFSIYRPFKSDSTVQISLSAFDSFPFISNQFSPIKNSDGAITLMLFPLCYEQKYNVIYETDWNDLINLAVSRLWIFLNNLIENESKSVLIFCKFHPSDYRTGFTWENLLISNENVKFVFPQNYSKYRDINAVPAEILVPLLKPQYLYFMEFSSSIFSNITDKSLKIVYDSFIWDSLSDLSKSPWVEKEKELLKYLRTNFSNFVCLN